MIYQILTENFSDGFHLDWFIYEELNTIMVYNRE